MQVAHLKTQDFSFTGLYVSMMKTEILYLTVAGVAQAAHGRSELRKTVIQDTVKADIRMARI